MGNWKMEKHGTDAGNKKMEEESGAKRKKLEKSTRENRGIKKVERNASLSRVYKGERFFSLLTPLPYFTSHPSILPNSIYGPQALPLLPLLLLLVLLRLGQSIAVHSDFVLKRTVPISLFRFMCVLESLSSLFLLCLLTTHLITRVY